MINTEILLKEMYQHNKHNKIKSYEIERRFDVKGKTVRETVNELRRMGYPICSDNQGYFYATEKTDLYETITNLEHRIRGIKNALNGLYDTLTKIK